MSTIIIDSVFILLGIILILYSKESLTALSYIMGGFIIATGLMSFYSYIRAKKRNEPTGFGVVYGILSALIGIILIVLPELLGSIIPVVLGIGMTITGALKIQIALTLKQFNQKAWMASLIMAIIIMIAGIFLIFNPFRTASALAIVIGIIIFIFAGLDVITAIVHKFYTREPKKSNEIELIKNNHEVGKK